MVRAEIMVMWMGIKGYPQPVMTETRESPREKMFFTRNSVAAL